MMLLCCSIFAKREAKVEGASRHWQAPWESETLIDDGSGDVEVRESQPTSENFELL